MLSCTQISQLELSCMAHAALMNCNKRLLRHARPLWKSINSEHTSHMLENNIDFWKLWLWWLLSRRKLELHALMAKLYIHKMDKSPKKKLLLLPIFFKTTTTPELSSLLNNLRSRREKKFQKLLVHLPKLLPIELGFYGHGRKCLL